MSGQADIFAQLLFSGQVPTPGLGRMMVFIDGENLVFRYQDMLKDGKNSRSDIVHEPDVFVWHSSMTQQADRHYVLRATYYTYAVGDDPRLNEIRDRIKTLSFNQSRFSSLPKCVTPYVLKKGLDHHLSHRWVASSGLNAPAGGPRRHVQALQEPLEQILRL